MSSIQAVDLSSAAQLHCTSLSRLRPGTIARYGPSQHALPVHSMHRRQPDRLSGTASQPDIQYDMTPRHCILTGCRAMRAMDRRQPGDPGAE